MGKGDWSDTTEERNLLNYCGKIALRSCSLNLSSHGRNSEIRDNEGVTKARAACWSLVAIHLAVLSPEAAVRRDLTEQPLVS